MDLFDKKKSETEAAKLVASLPNDIRRIVEILPFGASWILAAAINELRVKGNSDIYLRGIAIGMVSAAQARNEINYSQLETLALYIGNLPD